MKVLVTGGTGTISSGIAKASVKAGYETYAITRGKNKNRNVEGVKYVYGNLWNTDFINKSLDVKYDVVVECLVYTLDQLKISLNNFASRCNHYIFISTAGIYSRICDRRIKEDDEKNLVEWDYTKNKIECERYLIDFCKSINLNYTIVRPTVTYGDYRVPFPIATRNPGWTFFQRMLDGKPMLASDNVRYSIIHIDDFSSAVVALFENERAYNEDFHVSDNRNDIYWDDVIHISGDILNIKPLIIHVPVVAFKKIYPSMYDELKCNKNMSLLLDDYKIKHVTGLESRIDIKGGIIRIIKSMQSEFEQKKRLDTYWNECCDATIYYAYKKGFLKENEKRIVQTYIDGDGHKELIKNYWKIRVKYIIKKCIRR